MNPSLLDEVHLDAVFANLFAQDEYLLLLVRGRPIVGVVDDLQVGVHVAVLNRPRHDRIRQRYILPGFLDISAKTQSDDVQGAVGSDMAESLGHNSIEKKLA